MTKIAYNRCYGGFSLSHAGVMRYAELKGIQLYAFIDDRYSEKNLDKSLTKKVKYVRLNDAEAEKHMLVHYCTTPKFSNDTYWSSYDIGNDRSDPILIQVIEELGDKANGSCADIAIAELPTGTLYRIDEYDGIESIETSDSVQWRVA